MKKILFLVFLACYATAGAQQQFALLGDFRTTGGSLVKDCKIGYRILGRLNAEKSNAVLWPTWFGGTSGELVGGAIPGTLDTAGLCVIAVDALGNGVSSSPSNTPDFPDITVRDMVNSEYELLTKHLKISHLRAVMGVSMGGMQTYEWLVAHPDFMDKAVPIVGSPKLSFFDLLLWRTEADIIEKAGSSPAAKASAMEEVLEVHLMHLETPAYWVRTEKPENFEARLAREIARAKTLDADNWLCQLRAMMGHDIYASSGKSADDLKNVVKARVLVIAAKQDHMVNPASSVAFARALGCDLYEPDNDCGHIPGMCEGAVIRALVSGWVKSQSP